MYGSSLMLTITRIHHFDLCSFALDKITLDAQMHAESRLIADRKHIILSFIHSFVRASNIFR